MATPNAEVHQDLAIPIDENIVLHGTLHIPPHARGLVLFVHGSGSSRFSPRNRFVADRLVAHGMATLLMDLLTPQEEAVDEVTRELRFNIGLLTARVVGTIDWLQSAGAMRHFQIGLFGASTGAAAALAAASRRPDIVAAVVSRGGRPDLAAEDLRAVHASTLLIVGENDPQVLALNREAFAQLRAEKDLIVVPHATHLFEEPGTLELVAEHAAAWFSGHFDHSTRRQRHAHS